MPFDGFLFASRVIVMQNFLSLNDPLPFVRCFFEAYPCESLQLSNFLQLGTRLTVHLESDAEVGVSTKRWNERVGATEDRRRMAGKRGPVVSSLGDLGLLRIMLLKLHFE